MAKTTESAEVADSKKEVYEMIDQYIEQRIGKNIGRVASQDLFNMVVRSVFTIAVKQGIRFNRGYGALHFKDKTKKIAYSQGPAVQELLKEHRGVVEVPVTSTEATAPATPAAAAVPPVTPPVTPPVPPAKPAAAKPAAKPAAPPPPETPPAPTLSEEGMIEDLDLE